MKFIGYIKDPLRIQDNVFEIIIGNYSLCLMRAIKNGGFDNNKGIKFEKGFTGWHLSVWNFQLTLGKLFEPTTKEAEEFRDEIRRVLDEE